MADEKLSAAQRAKIRRLSQPKELAPDEEGGELNIVPFLDIIMNVLIFVLAGVTTTFLATITTDAPKRGGRGGAPTTPTLNLTVLVVPDGFGVKASGASLAAGCHDTGSGISVPKAQGDYDYKGLNACVAYVKKNAPDTVQDETSITITANPDIQYQVIVSTMDALRQDADGKDLFPDVRFGLTR